MATEVEAKLAVVSAEPGALTANIAALDAVGGLSVVGRRTHELSDTYFDTPDGRLAAARLALRVRTEDARQLVTIKGEARVQNGVISRPEIEMEWSNKALAQIERMLIAGGAQLVAQETAPAPSDGSAAAALRTLGLEAGSARLNRRTTLHLARDGRVLADLDIDHVRFPVGQSHVEYIELECEARENDSRLVVEEVVTDLLGRFEGLRPVSFSKLALGDLLQELDATGELALLLEGRRLRRESYDRIQALLGAD